MVNRLLRENFIPIFFNGKKKKKKCNPAEMQCNVNFASVFTALNNTKTQRKFNITPYGENVYQLIYWDKI